MVDVSESGTGFDLDEACANMELSREEVLLFIPAAVEELRARLGAVVQAVLATDLAAVALNSHTIKSVSASLSAETVCRAAETLEKIALSGDVRACPALLKSLEGAIGRLLVELERFTA